MIIGAFLAITVSISLASLGIIITGMSGALKENLATGAVIGTGSAISYASITLTVSLIATVFLISLIRKRSKSRSRLPLGNNW